jgi:Protein of unknown function (DUF3251)
MTTSRLWWTVLLAILVSACDQLLPGNAALAKRVTEAEQRTAKAQADVAKLQQQLAELKQSRQWDEIVKDFDQIAYLTPGAEGYSAIRFDLGVLTVRLADVRPYANGSKVTLRFGNTLSSAITGLIATIEWGTVNDKGVPDNATAKSKEMTFVQTLRGGAWTSIPVVLDGVPPAQLGFVRVSKVSHTGIRLLK